MMAQAGGCSTKMDERLRARVLLGPEALAVMTGAAVLGICNPRGDEATGHVFPATVDVELPTELASPGDGTRGSHPLPGTAALQAWVAAGLAVVHRRPAPEPGDVTLSPGHVPVLDADGASALARSGVLLDSRIRPKHIGGEIPRGAARRGVGTSPVRSPPRRRTISRKPVSSAMRRRCATSMSRSARMGTGRSASIVTPASRPP
jgi:hypothetical protein